MKEEKDMRKLVKLMTTTAIISTTAMQVTACKDDTQFDRFTNDVNETAKNNSAFLGFLGSADDETSALLQNSFDFFNEKENNTSTKTRLQEWNNNIRSELNNKKITNINLKYYQGPYHKDKPNSVDEFWKDKSISWQRSIFDWLLYNSKPTNNPGFDTPNGADKDVKPIDPKKDENGKDMFQKLPIVFIVSKGKLITAGQGWTNSSTPESQIETIKKFILANLLL